MSSTESRAKQFFELYCPDGGTFYICEGSDNEFLGCCTSNPCSDNSGLCPDGGLRTSSFAADKADNLPTQSCDDSRGASVWYKCDSIEPPFLGCCDQSPCGEGCPRDKLLPAVLSRSERNKQAFLNPEEYASSTTASSASSTASATDSAKHDGGLSTGAVAGIAAASAAIGVVLVGLLIWRLWCSPRKRKLDGQQFQPVATYMPQVESQGGFITDRSVAGYYQQPFPSTPNVVPYYGHGLPTEQYNKTSPHYGPVPMDFSNVYTIPNHDYSQASMMQTVQVQEMEGMYPTRQELDIEHRTQETPGSQDQSPVVSPRSTGQ